MMTQTERPALAHSAPLQHMLPTLRSIAKRQAAPVLSGDIFGALINLSGRRRFTSQRIILYAVLASIGHDGALAVSTGALEIFRDAHMTLINGTETMPGVYCKKLQDAYFDVEHYDQTICDFMALASAVQTAIQHGTRAAPALLQQLIDSGTPLLASLNHVTQIYEDLSKAHALEARKQLRSVMSDIESIAKQARMVALNARIVAAHSGQSGKSLAVVAAVMSDITDEMDKLAREALRNQIV